MKDAFTNTYNKNSGWYSKVFRYLIVGTVTNLSLIAIVILLKRLGFGYDWGLLVMNIFGLMLNFVLNKVFVFKDQTKVLKKIALYCVLYASVYGLQLLLYRAFFSFGIFHEYISIVITVAVSAIYAFVMLDKVVFVDDNADNTQAQ